MPESKNSAGAQGWQIRSDGKVYVVGSEELLRKIHREGRFKGHEEIRAIGGTWGPISSFDFQELSQHVNAPMQRTVQSHPSPTQPSQPVQAVQAGVKSQQSSSQESGWWKEDKIDTRNATSSKRKKITIVAMVAFGLAVGFGTIYALWPSPDISAKPRMAHAVPAENNRVAEVALNTTPTAAQVSDEPKAEPGQKVPIDQDLASDTPRKNNDDPALTAFAANKLAEDLESSEQKASSGASQLPLAALKKEPDASSEAVDSEMSDRENAPAKTTASADPAKPIGDKEVIVVETEKSASAILDQKSIADKMYDLIEAKISFYKKTNDSIQASRTAWIEARKKVELLEASIKENKLKYDQASSRVADLNASLANPAGLISQLQQKINQEKAERDQLNVLLPRLVLDTENKKRQWQSEQNTMLQSEKAFVETCKKEKESLDGMMLSIDFFAELPVEVHKRILVQAQNWTASEPDFFVAYLLHSAAAIWTEDYQIPDRNLNQMRRQAELLSPAEREARKQALQRFETIGIGLSALSKFKQNKTTDAIDRLQAAFKLDQTFAEIWLLRGQVGLERKGQADGNYYFQRAVALRRDDPRVYRIVLDSLIQRNEFPKSLVVEYLRDLVKRSVSNDERSWVTAADVAVRIGEFENANEYLSHVVEPYFQERKKKILSSIEAARSK